MPMPIYTANTLQREDNFTKWLVPIISLLLSQELFKHLPQQRVLSPEAKAKATQLLEMRANKKMVQQQLCQDTGNIILLKDLSNIATACKQGKSRNDLDITISTLMDKYGKYTY